MDSVSDLAAGTASGTQTTTQNPQSSSDQATSLNGQTSSVQSGTADNLLYSTVGVQLHGASVPSISLGATATPAQTTNTRTQHHGINPVLLAFAIVLFATAVVLFMSTTRSAKTTTKY